MLMHTVVTRRIRPPASLMHKFATSREPLRFTMWRDVWSYVRTRAMWYNSAVFVCGASTFVYVALLSGRSLPMFPTFSRPEERMLDIVSNGVAGLQITEAPAQGTMVERDSLVAKLENKIFDAPGCRYIVVVGEAGVGKTTAVRSALRGKSGAVYVDCPTASETFGIETAAILHFRPEIDIAGSIERWLSNTTRAEMPLELKQEPRATWVHLEKALMKTAKLYKGKYGRPMVFVIDSADILAKCHPEFLTMLQDVAKRCTGDAIMRFVFISSDGTVLPLLQRRSAWSRAAVPIEVGEILNAQAVSYLEGNGIPPEVAKMAVEKATGGLFAALQEFIATYLDVPDIDAILQTMDSQLSRKLRVLDISPNHRVFRKIGVEGRVLWGEALLMGITNDQLTALLQDDILATHPDDSLTFHDRHTQSWFKNHWQRSWWTVSGWFGYN